MRHKLSLPDQPSAVFLIIVFDLFALVAVYGLYGSNWVGQTGQEINLPTAETAPLSIAEKHIIVKVFNDSAQNCVVGKKAIPFTELEKALKEAREDLEVEEVLLMIDTESSIKREREVISLIQGLGMECSLIAKPK